MPKNASTFTYPSSEYPFRKTGQMAGSYRFSPRSAGNGFCVLPTKD